MLKFLPIILALTTYSCSAQTDTHTSLAFTSDLEHFESLAGFQKSLNGVEIIGLGENTHGLGEVFTAKTELVKFLHEALGFNMILFESGYGDAALAWEQLDSLSTKEFTRLFSSNFYYNSEEIADLVAYVKSQHGTLTIQGFDCQPQQNFLIQRMAEIAQPFDSVLAKSVRVEMRGFNQLYQFEQNNDTSAFNTQRDRFIAFLNKYDTFLHHNNNALLKAGVTPGTLSAIARSNAIFRKTYSGVRIGEMMGWPASANVRDEALFEVVKAFKEEHPESKLILWAQNSHLENVSKPNYNVTWMGHYLKQTYGDAYYSIGAVVYSGTNLNYDGTFEFEHDSTYLAYHLNQFQTEKFVLDLRNHHQNDFTNTLLLGMENNGATAAFVARDRFDGILFIRQSGIPTLIKKE